VTEHTSQPQLGLNKRILRALPVVLSLVLLTWIFGHTGVLHKLEAVAGDTLMRMNPPPEDSDVVLVTIDDEDYRKLFGASSPLNGPQLKKLIDEIAKGNPSVIAVDIDTSSPQSINNFQPPNEGTFFVWEREIREVPDQATGNERIDPLPILGGQRDVDPSRNSSGIPLLLDDPEDRVTRRYRRSILTQVGRLPSFPWAIMQAYWRDKPQQLAAVRDSSEDLIIRFSGDREGSHRLRFTAQKVQELSEHWPAASPIKRKIVLLGGSYLGEDRHDTPIGRLTGQEIIANVVETELAGGGHKVPSEGVLFLLELFEAFVLIVVFHVMRLGYTLAVSILLIPVMALLCSELAYGNLREFPQFAVVVTGLLVFELYEHVRRTMIPRVYEDLRGKGRGQDH
jgi:CHASE2 domain-containing sensor protein